MKTETLNVSGMTCGGCTSKVNRALTSLPGVAHVDVSLPKGAAEVTYDEGLVSLDRMQAALRTAGFNVAETPDAATPARRSCCS
jgi:copper chaperone